MPTTLSGLAKGKYYQETDTGTKDQICVTSWCGVKFCPQSDERYNDLVQQEQTSNQQYWEKHINSEDSLAGAMGVKQNPWDFIFLAFYFSL